jgi:MoaA/NifB/PqqE/SkfB family radical SAM enzyme
MQMPVTGSLRAAPAAVRNLRFDVGTRPFLVLVELTRACDLACRHCRADSVSRRDPRELTTAELKAMLDDLASLGAPRPRVVLTGGDPLHRPDLEDLVRHGSAAALSMAVSPAGTPRATRARFASLRDAGATAVSLSLDGAGASTHDAFRRVQGSFDWTVAACRAALDAGLRLQVNTTVSRETVRELPGFARLVHDLGV